MAMTLSTTSRKKSFFFEILGTKNSFDNTFFQSRESCGRNCSFKKLTLCIPYFPVYLKIDFTDVQKRIKLNNLSQSVLESRILTQVKDLDQSSKKNIFGIHFEFHEVIFGLFWSFFMCDYFSNHARFSQIASCREIVEITTRNFVYDISNHTRSQEFLKKIPPAIS